MSGMPEEKPKREQIFYILPDWDDHGAALFPEQIKTQGYPDYLTQIHQFKAQLEANFAELIAGADQIFLGVGSDRQTACKDEEMAGHNQNGKCIDSLREYAVSKGWRFCEFSAHKAGLKGSTSESYTFGNKIGLIKSYAAYARHTHPEAAITIGFSDDYPDHSAATYPAHLRFVMETDQRAYFEGKPENLPEGVRLVLTKASLHAFLSGEDPRTEFKPFLVVERPFEVAVKPEELTVVREEKTMVGAKARAATAVMAASLLAATGGEPSVLAEDAEEKKI